LANDKDRRAAAAIFAAVRWEVGRSIKRHPAAVDVPSSPAPAPAPVPPPPLRDDEEDEEEDEEDMVYS
jgi:hypothetical protein